MKDNENSAIEDDTIENKSSERLWILLKTDANIKHTAVVVARGCRAEEGWCQRADSSRGT